MRTSASVAAPAQRFELSRLLSATRLGLPIAVIGVLAFVAVLNAALGAFMVHMMSALAAMLLLACVVNTRAKAGEGFIRYLGYAMPWVAFFELALAFSLTGHGLREIHAHLEAGSELVQAGIWFCAALYAGGRIRPASASMPWGVLSAAIFGIVLAGAHGESTLAARTLALILLAAALALAVARRRLFAHRHPAFVISALAALFAGQLFAMADHTADNVLHATQFARLVGVWLVYLAALEGLPAAPWTSESTFRRMFEETAVSVALSARDGRLIAANPAAARMFGYDSVDALLANVPKLTAMHANLAQREALLERLERGEASASGDVQFRRRDGALRWMRLTLSYVRDADGGLLGLQGSAFDITDTKAAQERAALEQARLQRLFELLPVGVWMTDDKGKILLGNEAGRRIWAGARYVGPERYGEYKGWWIDTGKLIAAEEWPLARALTHGETRIGDEIAIECFDGSRKIIRNSAAPIVDEAGSRLGALVVNEDITAEKLRENALRESEARFRSLVELSSDYYWETDESLRFTVSTAATSGGLYPEASHVLGKRRWELAGALPVSSSWDEHRAVMEAKKPFRAFQYKRIWEGDVRYIEASGEPVFGAAGRFRGYRGVASDITERKRAEEAARRKDDYFRSLIESVRDGVAAADMDWRYVYVNPEMAAVVGVAPEALVGRLFAESTALGDHAALRERLARALAVSDRPQVERIEVRAANGERRVREVAVSKGLGPEGEPIYIIIGRDITDRIRTEQALAESERRFRALIEHGGDAVMLCDRDLRVIYRGGSAERVTGYSASDRVGRPMGEQVVEEDLPALKAAFAAALESPERAQPIACRYRRKDGAVIWIEGTVTNLLEDPAVGALVMNYRDVTERKRYEAHIEHLANHDGLTGLPNRMLLRDRVEQAILHGSRTQGHVGLIFVDLDQFKLINDSYGHSIGDALLKEVAKRLTAVVRSGDTVARIGGDEFVIVLTDLVRPDDTTVVARKVAEALSRPLELDARELHIGASMGISVSPGDGDSFDTLLRCADAAMYRAKDAGRGTYRFYSAEMGEEALARVQTETGLRRALERDELRLHYQPQVALVTGEITGFEALLRWEHPVRGLVSPASFIPIAEETGLIVPMGQWALRAACRDAAAWRAAGLGDMKVAVNLSARQFWQASVLESVRAALAESGLPASLLEIEITESVVARDLQQVMRALEQLRRMGVSVAIDDFGTGYSSLAYLRSLPIQKLKIDRSFIQGIPADNEATTLVGAIVHLAHVLSLAVVAEGVETQPQADFLRQAGCEAMQGFLFARPMPAAEAAALLRSRRRLA